MSIISYVANNKYSDAVAIADRKIESEFEPVQQKLDAVKFFYQENKADLSKKEEQQFQLMIGERERILNDQKETAKTLQQTKLSALQEAQANGAPSSVLMAIQKAQTPEAAFMAAGQYVGLLDRQLQNARIATEQAQAKKIRTEIDALGTPDGTDAPLYSGLSAKTATAVRGVVGQFKSEPQVTNFVAIQEGRNFAGALSDKTTNPADDQALIYSLAKVLDPGSVVREGEYATAQKYAQSWIKAYGKGVSQAISGTGFLSEDARRNIKNTIESRYQASKKSYDNVYGEYSRQINDLTGKDNGTKFLRNYTTPTTTSGAPENTTLMQGPDGKQYHVPNDKVDSFIKDGGKKL
jgi:hypothetical protein